jgi:hypothetical protein
VLVGQRINVRARPTRLGTRIISNWQDIEGFEVLGVKIHFF